MGVFGVGIFGAKIFSFFPGMKLEAVDPFDQLSLCVVTVRRVLRFGFLLLSIDNHSVGEEESSGAGSSGGAAKAAIFCAHSSSPYLLPAGFAQVNGLPLRAIPGKTEFFLNFLGFF